MNVRMVINKNGAEVDFEVALTLMDEDIVDTIYREWHDWDGVLHLVTDQEWFSRYETLHEQKYGEEWELSKANPTY